MSMRHAFPVSLIAAVLSVVPIGAHHSTAGVYDDKRTVTVEGVVTEFRFVNPHAMMSMDVTDDAGGVVKWTVEFAGRLNLSEGGWTEQSIRPGERITVTGSPSHNNSPRMLFRRLARSDGSQLMPPGAERINAIEEERRRRARERNQTPSK